MSRVSRRWVLAALAAGAGEALAAPERSLRPLARPGPVPAAPAFGAAEALVRAAAPPGTHGFAVADGAGTLLEAQGADLPLPPASTAKALTTLYALDALGAGHRFATRLLATGPLRDGRIEGDLVLAGGGDPELDTDGLAELAAELKAVGVRAVAGGFRVWGGAIPELREIDPEQPEHVGYNPALGGLSLNYNRVHFSWTRAAGRYDLVMDARAARLSPRVETARMALSDRALPVYTYADAGGADDWTVAESALGEAGARWLPVRHPALYAGDVFRTLARSHGIVLPAPVRAEAAPEGAVLAERQGAPLATVLRAMLRYSTNLTAETVGLAASRARGERVESLAASAAAMNRWLAARFGTRGAALVDHSGLGGASRIPAADMLRVLGAPEALAGLRPLLKMLPHEDPSLRILAKTGTLNFVSALVGYVAQGGASAEMLPFAVLTADLPRRAALAEAEREAPPGGRAWAGRSRAFQASLLQRWGGTYL